MKKQSLMLIIFILSCFFVQTAYAQQDHSQCDHSKNDHSKHDHSKHDKPHKEGQMPLPKVGLGKKVVTEVPDQPMFYYENGKKVELDQDFGFVGISFVLDPIVKEKRHDYYKIMRLVVSEISDPILLKNNMYVVRLTPGADEKKWNIFAAYMRRE